MASRELNSTLQRLPQRLSASGFTPDGLRQLLGVTFPDDVGLLNHAPMIERIRHDRSRAATLTRLFYLEEKVTALVLRRAIPTAEQMALARAGLLARRGKQVWARLRIDTIDGNYILADRRFCRPDPSALGLPAGDMVYPPGSDSAILTSAVLPQDDPVVLDLCTGPGVQGIALSRRARRVVGVDIGRRAVAMAEANAYLNAIRNFEVRQGDLFGPVGGERFDLIVANPPFVASPRRGPAYHSGGARGDDVLARILRGLGKHLKPGGRAFVISHLTLRKGGSVADRIQPWVRSFPGRVLALALEGGTPVDLAAAQSLFALDGGFASYTKEVRRWVEFLHRQAIDRVVLLLFVADRRGRSRLDVIEAFQRTLALPLSPPPRDHVAKWLESYR